MILINHTNHPSSKWSEAQKAGFEKIIDVPFPNIDPNWTMKEVENLVSITLNVFKQLQDEYGVVGICIQGEFSYCYDLFKELLDNYYYFTEILIPTTERRVIEDGDTKTVTFEFVKWRSLFN